MNDPDEILSSLASLEELEKEKADIELKLKIEREKNQKAALAELEKYKKEASASLDKAEEIAEKFAIEFGWTAPDGTSITFRPATKDYDGDDDYGYGQTGWLNSSAFC